MANKIENYGSALARYYANLSNEKKSAKAQKTIKKPTALRSRVHLTS